MDQNKGDVMHQEYMSRINIVQDYIDHNISKAFTLEELSHVSGFSKYHFHRIFAGMMNETLYHFINRQKLEKAANCLLYIPYRSVTDIALDFGFADSAMFARSFKKHYGMSATEYRNAYRKNRKAVKPLSAYNEGNTNDWRKNNMKVDCKVEVVDIPELTVVYLRHVGSYAELGEKFQDMIGRLFAWGSSHRVMQPGVTKLLTVYHDNPEFTEDDKRRTSICLTVPEDTQPDGDFGKTTIPAGKYAIGHFSLYNGEQHSQAWQYFYGEWLPSSGYQPDDGAIFEEYVNDPNTHPENKHLIDIYLPIKPM